MKLIRNFWREIFCIFFLSIFLYISVILINDPPETSFGRFAIILLGFANFFAFAWLLRELWRKKWKKRFLRIGQSIFEKLSSFFMRAAERILKKFNIGRKHRKNIIGGNAKITFDSDIFEKKAAVRKKHPKWKNLQSDRERLSFLYRQMINSKIKSGTRVYACDTPSELLERTQNNDAEKEIFDLYIGVRYDERANLPTNNMSALKESLEAK